MIDLNNIKEISFGQQKKVEGLGQREFVKKIELEKEPRIKVIRGFRGLGKTTALLQLLGEKAVYFSMDHPYVSEFSLYELCSEFIKQGYDTFLIDEIQYYPNWKGDTKALYDEYSHIKIVVSGSAPLAFEPERRYKIIDVNPMSLAEFRNMIGKTTININETWKDIDQTIKFLAMNADIYEDFNKYLEGGAFPTFFQYENDKKETLKSVYSSMEKSIRSDAASFAKVDGETIRAMQRLIVFLASSPLGEFSINSLTKTLEIKKHKAYEIVELLEKMKILRLVRPYGKGSKTVRGEPKLMFYHPVLRTATCEAINTKPNIGAVREELAAFSFSERGWKVNTIKGMKKSPDYIIHKNDEKIVVEIGGEGKTRTQLKGFKEEKIVITEKQLITLALF